MCCSLLLKTALGRRRQRLQMFPHHQMPCLDETAPVASVEGSIIPVVIDFGWFVDVLGIFWPLHLAAWQSSQQDHVEKMNVNWLRADTLNHGVIEVVFMWKSSIILFDDALKTWLHLWQDASWLLRYQFVFNMANNQKHRINCTVLFVDFTFVILHNNLLSC